MKNTDKYPSAPTEATEVETELVSIDEITKEALKSFSYAFNAGLLKKAYENAGFPQAKMAVSRVDYVLGYITASQQPAKELAESQSRITRLENMLKYARNGYNTLIEYEILNDKYKDDAQAIIDKIESIF